MQIKHIEIRNFRGIKSLSWTVRGTFNCIIGPGDTCKTTILTALDFALSPRSGLSVDDSDFYNQDVKEPIVIQVTLSDWDEKRPDMQKFFQESTFAQFKCGLGSDGPLPEPKEGGPVAVSVSLRVDDSLEPTWHIVKGRDEGEDSEKKPIYAADRTILGASRIDIFSDFHFTWGRNTILTRLSANSENNLNTVLAALARDMRATDISHHASIQACQTVAGTIKKEAQNAGVRLVSLQPKIDLQRQSVGSGSLSLHEDDVPLRNKGSGTKRLIGTAMQMKLHGGKNVSLIDELEMGLEPHRTRGLICKLKNSGQQIFATTHSPVVVRELSVSENELYICKRQADGSVFLESLSVVPEIQGQVRANAEAFLGRKIVGCEGPTEIGLIRAYDLYRFDSAAPPVWSLATSYLNCGGAPRIKPVCGQLLTLGYQAAVLCDNDAPAHLPAEDVQALRDAGAHVCQWDNGLSTERQLLLEVPWQDIPGFLRAICDAHDTLQLETITDLIIKDERIVPQNLQPDASTWDESPLLRRVMGDLYHKHGWIKRIDYAERAFAFSLPRLPENGVIKTRLATLWSWIQGND